MGRGSENLDVAATLPLSGAKLSTLCLYRAGYDFKRLFTISEYYDRDRPSFYRAIQNVRESGMDMTGWLEYYVEGLTTEVYPVFLDTELGDNQ